MKSENAGEGGGCFGSTTTRRCGFGRRSGPESWRQTTTASLRVRSAVKAGGQSLNHNDALRVRSAVKAGSWRQTTTACCASGQRSRLEGRTSITTRRCECGQRSRPEVAQPQPHTQQRSGEISITRRCEERQAGGQPQSQRGIASSDDPQGGGGASITTRPSVRRSSLSGTVRCRNADTRVSGSGIQCQRISMATASPIPTFRALAAAGGPRSPRELLAHADLLDRWRLDVRRALSDRSPRHRCLRAGLGVRLRLRFARGARTPCRPPRLFSGLAARLASAVQTRGHRSDDRSGRRRRSARYDPAAAVADSGLHSACAAPPAGCAPHRSTPRRASS